MMRTVSDTPITPVRMPVELRRAVQAKAETEGTNLSAIVRAAMQDYLDGKWTP